MYEKCKVVLTVILPHLINDKNKYKVLYSPFHRWEHLFIKILKSNLQKYSEIYGQCSAKETILTIIYEYDNKYEYESKNIKNILRYGHISRKKVDKEKYIINNEISFLEYKYNLELKKYDSIDSLNYIEMKKMRRIGYKWDEVEIKCMYLEKINYQDESDELCNMQNSVYSEYLKVRNLFFQRKKYSLNFRDVNSVVLMCIPLCSIKENKINEVESIYNMLCLNKGFFNNFFNNRNPFTNILIPKLEKNRGKNWITIYTYVNERYIEYIIDRLILTIEQYIHKLKLNFNNTCKIKKNCEIYIER